jgi:diguanylate cyclase (GGDEF)-like protein
MKILIAEDEPVSRRVLEMTLRKLGYDVLVACDGKEAWQLLQREDAPKLAILDWMMPGMDGPDVCREIRRRTEPDYTYILLLTARSGREDTITGLEAGADDYLVKPFDTHELKARLNVGRRILSLQNQYLKVCEELQYRATHDALTGAWNRAAILEMLERECARAGRGGTHLGLVMADLDHFKQINDTFGHPAGDAVLRETARLMRGLIRSYDALGRYGGEEFLLVLPGCNAVDTLALAERLREGIAAAPVCFGKHQIPVTVSLGATALTGSPGGEAVEMLHQADLAMYRAKRAGRNQVQFGLHATASATTDPTLAESILPIAISAS